MAVFLCVPSMKQNLEVKARIVTHSATILDLAQKLSLCKHSWAT